MKKSFISILFLIIICYSLANSQVSRMRRDGLWWNALDESHKYNYIVGYAKGISLGSDIVISKYVKNSKCYNKGVASIDTVMNMLSKIDVDQMIYHIDSLYKADSTNLCLMTFHCFWIVANQLSNVPSYEVNNIISYYRREDCDKFRNIQELKEYKLSY